MENVTYISHQSYMFKGTIRDNLRMSDPDAEDDKMWEVLRHVKLDGYIKEQGGLDMKLNEQASNLSGGQRQRLALARALMRDNSVYIFDEATSNIDVERARMILWQRFIILPEQKRLFLYHIVLLMLLKLTIYMCLAMDM